MSKAVSQLQACESLIREHRQMEALLDKLTQALSGTEENRVTALSAVRAVMDLIEPEMNTHFACEEKALFPAVSPYHPMVLMEVEHEELIALRDGLLTLLRKPEPLAVDLEQMREIGLRFISDMQDHIGREDAGIFPTCERALSDDEKAEVIADMDRIRAEAATNPQPSITRPERSFQMFQADLESPPQRAVFSKRLFDSTDLEIKHLIVQGGQSLASHWSPKQITLICLKGEGLFTANNQEIVLQPGASIVMTPQLLHGVQAQTDCHLLLLLR